MSAVLNLALESASLAIPAVGIYLLIEYEQRVKKSSDKDLANLYLALGITFVVFGAGPMLALAGRVLNMISNRRALSMAARRNVAE